MMANGDSKYPDWMHDEMPDALDTISDINLCKYMGWTFDQLDEQYSRHPDKVTVLANYINAESDAARMRQEKAKKASKQRGRGARRARRRGRR